MPNPNRGEIENAIVDSREMPRFSIERYQQDGGFEYFKEVLGKEEGIDETGT